VVPDDTGAKATAITWTKTPVAGSMLTDPGVYCLRSNETTWDAEKLWRTYTMLTDLDIDQPWRLSRFKVGFVGVRLRRGQAA